MATQSTENLLLSDSSTDAITSYDLPATSQPAITAKRQPCKPPRRNMFVQQAIVHRQLEDASNTTAQPTIPVPMPRRNITAFPQPARRQSITKGGPTHQSSESFGGETVIEVEPIRPLPRRSLMMPTVPNLLGAERKISSESEDGIHMKDLSHVPIVDERKADVEKGNGVDVDGNASEYSSSTTEFQQPFVNRRRPKRTAECRELTSSDHATVATRKSSETPLYSYEKLIGLHLHDTGPMLFDYTVRAPMIRCSLYDVISGKMLAKSDPNRSTVLANEPATMHYLQPLLSKASRFKESEFIECIWDELLVINEDIAHIQTGNEVIFFEILSIVSRSHSDFLNIATSDGWQYVCWAFLRPGDGESYSYVGKRCRLQLFDYRRGRRDVLEQWRMPSRTKYAATLDVTLRAFSPSDDAGTFASMRRPQNALQTDRLVEPPAGMAKWLANNAAGGDERLAGDEPLLSSLPPLSRWQRPHGQPCRMPNRVVNTLQASRSRGSLAARFSPNANRLAIALVPERPHQAHDLVVVRVPDGAIEWTLSGHRNLVYALDWHESGSEGEHRHRLLLLSVSSDRMAIVWQLHVATRTYDWTVLPHPCFLYAGRFLRDQRGGDAMLIVTGGRDRMLRVWRWRPNESGVRRMRGHVATSDGELVQEISTEHVGYVTAVLVAPTASHLYSADWSGTIVEWTSEANDRAGGDSQLTGRTLAQLGGTVRQMLLHPNEQTLFVLHNDSSVVFVSVSSGQPVRTIDLMDVSMTMASRIPQRQPPPCIGVSSCGGLLFGIIGTQLHGWSILDGQQTTPFRLPIGSKDERNDEQQGVHATSIDSNRHSFLCSVSVYATKSATGTAGVLMLGFEKPVPIKRNSLEKSEPFSTDDARKTPELIRKNVETNAGSDQRKPYEDLDLIIQRIDDIFNRPQNKTDDVKTSQRQMQQTRAEIDGDVDGEAFEMHSIGAGSLTRSNTFVIHQRDVDNVDGVELNRTYSVSSRIGGPMIERDEDGGTTVSESM